MYKITNQSIDSLFLLLLTSADVERYKGLYLFPYTATDIKLYSKCSVLTKCTVIYISLPYYCNYSVSMTSNLQQYLCVQYNNTNFQFPTFSIS